MERFTPDRISWAIEKTSRLIPAASCLTQAIAAHVMFHWAGIQSSLRIGVAKTANLKLSSHAWVEIDNRIFIGGHQQTSYAPLLTVTSYSFGVSGDQR